MSFAPHATQERPDSATNDLSHRQTDFRTLLKRAGLSITSQRLALGALLYSGPKHVTVGALHQKAVGSGLQISLATVYNTLNLLAESGLLRRVNVGGQRMFFDTDMSDHYHFYIVDEDRIIDVAAKEVHIGRLPDPREGYAVARVEVIIRLRGRAPTCTGG